MLSEIYPRVHARYLSLRVLGPHLDGFVVWLRAKGYPRHPICTRIRAARRLDARSRKDFCVWGQNRAEEQGTWDYKNR